jgi:phosphatidylethanolamine/phosphatidyl-N-methylethanolamine N-methyltransferase
MSNKLASNKTGEKRFLAQAEQNWLFFRQWVRAPLSTASVVPSSRFLAEKMIAEVPLDARQVIELGAGTGVFTKLLVARGTPLDQVMVVELNEVMAANLTEEFPSVHVVNGDATQLRAIVNAAPDFTCGKIDAVVSGLGFLNMPNAIVQDIVAAAFDVMAPTAPLVQFTYGPKTPIASAIIRALHLKVRRASFTLRNFPPASVYVYTR